MWGGCVVVAAVGVWVGAGWQVQRSGVQRVAPWRLHMAVEGGCSSWLTAQWGLADGCAVVVEGVRFVPGLDNGIVDALSHFQDWFLQLAPQGMDLFISFLMQLGHGHHSVSKTHILKYLPFLQGEGQAPRMLHIVVVKIPFLVSSRTSEIPVRPSC